MNTFNKVATIFAAWIAVITVAAWLLADTLANAPKSNPGPKAAPRTINVDGVECRLWPLESRYGHPDPHFFWLCPGAGPQGRDTWGLAWTFNDVNAETK